MPTTPSPLRYPGGKTSYAPMLQQIIRDNDLAQCDYVEPFAGGAGAAITLLFSGCVRKIWLNDLDYSIFAFWKAILDHTNDFINLIKSKRISIAEWKRQRLIYGGSSNDILTKGFATFYLNRCNRAGILSANPIGGLHQKSDYSINARFKKNILIAKIKSIAEMRDRISVSNQDAKKFLSTYHSDNRKTLVYFDPPYFQKGGLLYMNSFTHKDHETLSKCILKCNHPWILSYDDQKEIRSLYTQVNTYCRGLNYSVSKPSVGMELIISNLTMPKSLKMINGERNAS